MTPSANPIDVLGHARLPTDAVEFTMQASVDRGVFRRLLQTAAHLGGDDQALRCQARLPAVLPPRLDVPRLFRLWRIATAQVTTDLPWAVAGSVQVDDLGLFGFSVQTSPTADIALTTACRLFSLISQGPRPVRLDPGTLRVGPQPPKTAHELATREAVLAHFVHLSRQTAPDLRIEKLYLRRRLHRNDRARDLGIPVVCDAGHDAVVFDPKTLDSPTRFAHTALHAYLQRPSARALRALADHHDDDLPVRVAAIVERRLAECPTAEEVAAELGLAPRTLRRRLANEDTSFRQLVSRARKSAAVRLVRDPSLPLTEVAAALGYAELSALSRAYREWFGEPPSRARRAAVAEPNSS